MEQGSTQQYPREYSGYTLLESIGQGGMSAIDLAQTTVSDAQYLRFVVIKRMHAHLSESDESYIRMFQDEARISAELQHANIAQVYNFGQCDNEFFMVMEYVPGLDLRELQRGLASQGKGIPIRITLKILYDVLQALDYAHHRVDTFGQSLNIVHRDVNPRNVMLSIRGEVKLIDFGVAKADNRMDKTVGHTIKGKFAYMAPEQIDPTIGNIDGRADLFAVGLMLYEMVAGQRPFHGLNEIQIMHKIMSVDIPDLPKAPDHPKPEQLQAIFNMVTEKDPSARYATAGQMAMAVQQAALSCGGLATTADMANFLRVNMPEKTNTIATRLSQYKTDATMNSGILSTVEAIEYLELTPSESTAAQADTIKHHRPQSPMVSTNTIDEMVQPEIPYAKLALGGLLLFALGFGGIVYFASPSDTPKIAPTQKTVKTRKIEQIDQQTNKPEPTEQPSVVTPSKPVEQKASIKSTSTNRPPKPTSVDKSTKPSTQPEHTEEKAKPTPKIDTTTEANPQKLPVTPNSVVESTKPTPKIETETFYLMVGVESGTRGLPVFYQGREITTTGAKKSVTLPIGSVQLEIRDPKTSSSVYQTITVQKGDPILTVQVHRM